MRQYGVLVRRQFPARSPFAPQILNFFFVRRRLLCAIARWARTLQGRELNINFFIQLLYHLLIPWMRVPRFLENAETRYFIPKLSCQRRLNGEAKAIGDDAWLSRPSGLPWVRVGHRRRRHFDLNRGRCFGVM